MMFTPAKIHTRKTPRKGGEEKKVKGDPKAAFSRFCYCMLGLPPLRSPSIPPDSTPPPYPNNFRISKFQDFPSPLSTVFSGLRASPSPRWRGGQGVRSTHLLLLFSKESCLQFIADGAIHPRAHPFPVIKLIDVLRRHAEINRYVFIECCPRGILVRTVFKFGEKR